MIRFKYLAKENTGNTVEGTVEAETSDEAAEKINRLGYFPIKIAETRAGADAAAKQEASTSSSLPTSSLSFRKISSKEITAFSRQLSSLIRSGVPILRAIGIVSEQSESPHFKSLLSSVHDDVKNGIPLSVALAKHPRFFPPLYLALVSAGEASGNLDQTLAKITEYRQKQEEILSRVRTAMIYPILMAVTGAGTIVFMLTFVMPRLSGVFSNLGGHLPLPTRILIQVSNLMRHGWVLGIIAAIGLLLSLQFAKKSKSKSSALSAFVLKIPVFGSFVLKAEIARFARTLELLLKSGLSILRAIDTTIPVLSNVILRNELTKCSQDLKEGGSFGKSLRKSKQFPIFLTNLIMIGEESGKLDEALGEIALFYERETDEAIRALTALMEPLMILVMGLVVGFIVIAMLLPMFELNMIVK